MRVMIALALFTIGLLATVAQAQDACTVCTCIGTSIDCSLGVPLVSLPTGGPNTTEHIILDKAASSVSFTAAFFQTMPLLKTISMMDVTSEQIEETAFQNLPYLETLIFSMRMTSMPTNIFNIPSLKTLKWMGTRIVTLNPSTLAPLTNLLNLTISYSGSLRSLLADSFVTLTNLRYLEVSSCIRITLLPSGVFRTLTSLRNVKLDSNRIALLDADLFNASSVLKTINLSRNRLRTFPNTFFQAITLLNELEVSTNIIQFVSASWFPPLSNLQMLNLQYNAISYIEPGSFISQTSLTALTFENNRITELTPSVFSPLTSMTQLTLSYNYLDARAWLAVEHIPNLQTLNLGFNSMLCSEAMPFNASTLPQLQTLIIKGNAFANLTCLCGLSNLKYLDASQNAITSLPNMRTCVPSLKTLIVTSNSLSYIASNSMPLGLEMFTADSCQLTSLSFAANLTNLTSLIVSANQLTKNGVFALSNTASLTILDVSYNLIEALVKPALTGMPNLQTLSMLNNRITLVGSDVFQSTPLLTNLNMDENYVSILSSGLFTFNLMLKKLSMRHNLLSTLSRSLFLGIPLTELILNNNLFTTAPSVIGTLPYLQIFNLSDNNMRIVPRGSLPESLLTTLSTTPQNITFNNPTICSYLPTSISSTLHKLQCQCASGTLGDGTFCEENIICLAGSTDANNVGVCSACSPGTYTAANNFGPCPQCVAGQIDADSNPATPCIQCSKPGYYVPPGQTGLCDNVAFFCPAGSLDHDNNPATPCVDICNVCNCTTNPENTQLMLNCSSLNLQTFRVPTTLAPLLISLTLDNNSLTDLPFSMASDLPRMTSLTASRNNISNVDVRWISWARSQAIPNFLTLLNPTVCAVVNSNVGNILYISCQCAPGYIGNGTSCTPVSQAEPVMQCPSGYTNIDAGLNISSCAYCKGPGLYVPQGSIGACQFHACGSATTDHDMDSTTPCVPCPPGTFTPTGSSGTCASLRCPAGSTDHDINAATPCVPCEMGAYLAQGSAGACSLFTCQGGSTDADRNAASACIVCPSGSYVPPGSVNNCASFICAAGTTDDDNNPATPCLTLPRRGYYSPQNSSGPAILYPCNAGTVDDDFDASTVCVACPAGLYVPVGSSGACSSFSCEDGSIDDDSNPATPCARTSASSASAMATIGAPVIGVVMAFLLAFLIIVVVLRRMRKNAIHLDFGMIESEYEFHEHKPPTEIDPRSIHLIDHELGELGEGAQGSVKQAYMHIRIGKFTERKLVAVKKPLNQKNMEGDDAKLLWMKEAVLMAQFKCNHIVTLIGITKDPLQIIMEYCEKGSLFTVLRSGVYLSVFDRIKIMRDVASGLAFLHSKLFVHRDIAARNVCLKADLTAKLTDFGLARRANLKTKMVDVPIGSETQLVSVPWAAPEIWSQAPYSFSLRADCYSYGMVLFEIFNSGAEPFGGACQSKELAYHVRNGLRPSTSAIPEVLQWIVHTCWSKDPEKRPSAEAIERELNLILELKCTTQGGFTVPLKADSTGPACLRSSTSTTVPGKRHSKSTTIEPTTGTYAKFENNTQAYAVYDSDGDATTHNPPSESAPQNGNARSTGGHAASSTHTSEIQDPVFGNPLFKPDQTEQYGDEDECAIDNKGGYLTVSPQVKGRESDYVTVDECS